MILYERTPDHLLNRDLVASRASRTLGLSYMSAPQIKYHIEHWVRRRSAQLNRDLMFRGLWLPPG